MTDSHDDGKKEGVNPNKATISGVLGVPRKPGRTWEATESGSFKVVSFSNLKVVRKGSISSDERLSISVLPSDSNDSNVSSVPPKPELLADADRSKRTPYIAKEGDHLSRVALKAYGRTSSQLESLILRVNPQLEVRRSYSIESSTDRSYLQSGVSLELPSWSEVEEI